MASDLLPRNRTAFEVAFSDAIDRWDDTDPAIVLMRSMDFTAPPPDWLPFVIWEYGLGELTPYVPNLYDLILEGLGWQRVRGTPSAISRAFGWIGYGETLEEFPTRRRHWNRFMLELDRIRDAEVPDLERTEALGTLSSPLRSVFWRGWQGYDVRAMETGRHLLSQVMLSSFSGVRLPPGRTKWSFGRRHEADHTLTQSELEGLGVWIAPSGGSGSGWAGFSWNEAGISWNDGTDTARNRIMARQIATMNCWLELLDAGGETIGYRKAKAMHQVAPSVSGLFQIGGVRYQPNLEGEAVYVEAMTDFGDGQSSTASSWRLLFDAVSADPDTPGLLWANPGELAGGLPPVADQSIDLELGRTVRERFAVLLRLI